MPEVYRHMGVGSPKQVLNFAGQRIREIDDMIKAAQDEKEMWEKIRADLNPCPKCAGNGELFEHISQNEAWSRACKNCGGSGISEKK